MKRSPVFLFPDTNSLLHYPPIADVDWKSICDAECVTIVICMQVIAELDDKKSDLRLAERARRVIKEIASMVAASGYVRDGVSLQTFLWEPRREQFPSSLSPDNGDDCIIHQVERFAKDNRGEAMVYSEDYGMSLKCQTRSIRYIRPDESKRLSDPSTELQKKHKAVAAELEKLKLGLPHIEFYVRGCDHSPGQALDPVELLLNRSLPREDIERAVERERAAIRLLESVDWNDCEEYLQNYRAWIEDWVKMVPLMFFFDVELLNKGGNRAEDVEAILRLPPKFRCIQWEDEHIGETSVLPAQPERPKLSKKDSKFDDFPSYWPCPRVVPALENLPKFIGRYDPFLGLGGDAKSGFTLAFYVPKLNPDRPERFGNIFACFVSLDDVGPFESSLTITAANLPKRIERKIPFKIRVED